MLTGRRRPSALALHWVERSLGGARVVAWRRMRGGIGSVVHRLTVDYGSYRGVVVLRQYESADRETAALVRCEAGTLGALRDSGLPVPELIAADEDGRECDGQPAVLMTRLPGRLDLTPSNPDDWVRQIALMAARIHSLELAAPPFQPGTDAVMPVIPSSATRTAVWTAALQILGEQAPEPTTCFTHGDFQHFNLLWRRGRLTGVVDWTMSCAASAGLEVGHCRLNLAVLFGADWAERLRRAYEAEVGRSIDPWWDLWAVAGYGDDWREFIPVQVAGRAPVDTAGMTARVERLLETIIRRV